MKISEDLCNYLEAVQVDLEGTKDLIAFLMRDTFVDQNNLDYYKKQYDDLYLKYTLIKKEISAMYLNGNENWILDYATRELKPIDKKEGCCSCGNH